MLFNELKKIGNLEFVLHKILNSVQIALLLTDKDGNIVYANQNAEQLFGFDQLSLVKMKIEELLPERLREKHALYRDEYIQVPKSRSMGLVGRVLLGLRIDKTEFPVEVGLTPLRMASGLYVLAAVVDVTEREIIRKRLEHERENNSNLNVINDQLSEFSHMVSHDLNNPLLKIERIVGKLVKYIKKNEASEEILESVDVLLESIQKSKNLISDLLAFARTAHINLVEIDSNDFVRDLIKGYFDVEDVDIKINNLPKVNADSILLRHIFLNLISNSIKYNDKEHKIVEIGFDKNQFYVKDNGVGIAKDDIDKLFKPFTKIPDNKNGGTGIGLSICKKAVERHGGKIWMESQETVGSTVFFTLIS